MSAVAAALMAVGAIDPAAASAPVELVLPVVIAALIISARAAWGVTLLMVGLFALCVASAHPTDITAL
ncbi:MAG TPA: hypothetical protein VNL77_05430 [Roseiflexaceae bacterium]|nr:hypothetical protein [Roseiflexaceae bacterium]